MRGKGGEEVVWEGKDFLKRLFLCVFHRVDILQNAEIARPEVWEAQEERDDFWTLYPLAVLNKELEEGEGSEARVEGLGILEAAGPRVLDDVDN